MQIGILSFILYTMTERKPQYTVKRKSKAVNRPIKSAKIGVEFHALLTAMYNETDAIGMTMIRLNELALREFAERYYPQCLPVLAGGVVDESKRRVFENQQRSADNDTSG